MEPMFLSHEEVLEMTGAGTREKVIGVLVKNGIRHTIKANGWPCVPRAAVLGSQVAQHEKPAWQPRKAG